MTQKIFRPWAGQFYNANDGIRFQLKQTIDQTSNYTHDPIPSYIAASSHIIGAIPTRNTAASYPYWRFKLRHELTPVLPFPNQATDTFFDIPFINAVGGGFVLDNSGLIDGYTVNVPIAITADDLVIDYPTNDADPPIITGINPSTSFDYTVGYYVGGGVCSKSDFGTFNLPTVATFIDFRVTFPNVPNSGNTKFFSRLNVYKPSSTWIVQFERTLGSFNHSSRVYTV